MGHFSSQPVVPLDRQPGLRDNVTRQLMAAIFNGTVRSGDRMGAQKLAEDFGVSSTPVREALVELASVGLIEILPNRGAVCLPFGVRELREIYHLRRVFEVEATRLACGNLSAQDLREMRDELLHLSGVDTQDWSSRAIQLDTRLHGQIAKACDSVRLRYEIDRYQNLMQSIREVLGDQNHVQHRAVEEHLEIIDALLREDAEAACKAMARHLDQTALAVEQAFFTASNA